MRGLQVGLTVALALLLVAVAQAADKKWPDKTAADLPLVLDEKFANGEDRWQPADPKGWKLIDAGGGKALSLFAQNDVKTPHRSPRNIAVLKDLPVGDCVMEVTLRST